MSIETGVKPYFNFVSFRISPRAIGGGVSMVNTFGLNHIFTQTDAVLKYYNFTPTVTRIFNSAERGMETYFNNHFGMFGKYWWNPFEHCLIENEISGDVTEISPTGARNAYVESSGTYTTPDGINATLTKSSGEFDLEIFSHSTFHFKNIDTSDTTLYQLEYIEDRNGVRLYVEREGETENYRINSIKGSTDGGTTKEALICFQYITKTISSTTYQFVSSVTDLSGRQWYFSHNSDGELVSVTYPDGNSYKFEYNEDSFISKIVDMRKTEWNYTYASSSGDLATSYVTVDATTHTTYYNYVTLTRVAIIRDARSADNSDTNYEWEYTHDTNGCVTGFDDPLNNTTNMQWTSNRLTRIELPNSVEGSSNDYTVLTYTSNDLAKIEVFDNSVEQYEYYFTYNNHDMLSSMGPDGDNEDVGTLINYDANHNPIKIQTGAKMSGTIGNDVLPPATFITYNAYGQVTRVTDPLGNKITYGYGDYGSLETVENAKFKITYAWDETFVYLRDIVVRPVILDLPDKMIPERKSQFRYNCYGQLLTSFGPLGISSSLEYDSTGNVITTIDPNGNCTNITYFENNLPERVNYPDGGRTDYAYSKVGDLTSLKIYHDGSAKEFTYTYNNGRRLTTITNPLSETTTYTYDYTGNVLTKADNGGNTITFTYDFMNRLTKVQRPTIGTETSETEYTYTGVGNITDVKYKSGPSGSQTIREYTYVYHPSGLLKKVTFPEVTYDSDTYTFGEEYKYDKNNNLKQKTRFQIVDSTRTDRDTFYYYDSLNRLTKTRNEYDTNKFVESTYSYDLFGQLASDNANGESKIYKYDEAGRLTAYFEGTDNGLPIQQYRYDDNGNRIWVSDGDGGDTKYTYDSRNRIIALIDQEGRVFKNEYYDSGLLKKKYRPDGNYTKYEYDDIGRKSKVYELIRDYTNPDDPPTETETLRIEYTWTGSPTTLQVKYKTLKTSPSTYFETTYTLDTHGRLWKTQYYDADGSTVRTYTYEYDGVNNLVEITKPDNTTIERTYNLLNQMTQEKYGVNDYIDYQYSCCALTKHTRTIGGTPQNSFEITYDKMNHVLEESFPSLESMKYQIDAAGRRTQVSDPTYGQDPSDPQPTPIEYNEKGMVTGISRDSIASPIANKTGQNFEYEYDTIGRLIAVTFPSTMNYPNKTKIEYAYNRDYTIKWTRVVDVSAEDDNDYEPREIYNYQYKYDRNGWITQKIFKHSASTSIPTYRAIYEYDERGQIARERYEKYDDANKVMETVLDVTYEYDLAGNITKKNYSDGSYMSYSYSIGYQMISATDGVSNTWIFSYDANGNMTERRAGIAVDFQAVYDELNRLQEYRFASVGNYNSIEYDGIGRVWKRTNDESDESFYYHTGTKLAQELDDSNDVTVDYMAGSRRYMPNEEDDNYRYYVKDHLGSVVMMTDRDATTGGLTAEFYTYDSWGEHADTGAAPSTLNNIRYAGGRVEFFADGTAEGAVYLCGERHYMPMYGRFLQRDRLTYEKLPSPTNPLSANPYIYAENNPVMKKDINGLQPAGYYRGATMWGKTVIIGTQMPPEAQIYDCCGGGYHSLDATEVSFSLIHSTRLPGSGQAGFIDFTRLSKNAGWNGSLCDANPNEGQPNERCPETTTATSDLLCTYVERCMGGTCPDWNHPGDCPEGKQAVDVGGDGDPTRPQFEEPENAPGLIAFTDDFGRTEYVPTEYYAEFASAIAQYKLQTSIFLQPWDFHVTGGLAAVFTYFPPFLLPLAGMKYDSCGDPAAILATEAFRLGLQNTTIPSYTVKWLGFPGNWDPRTSVWESRMHNWAGLYLPGENWYIVGDPWRLGSKVKIQYVWERYPI